MAGAKDMTTPGAKLTCDQGCTNTFTTRGGYEKHMKNKHENVIAGNSKDNASNVVATVLTSEDEEAILEAVEDQELYDALDNIESDMKKSDNDGNNGLIEKLHRLRVIIQKKNKIQKEFKEMHDLEVSNRDEVEEAQKTDIDTFERKLKLQKERNLAILKESKKKKKANKDLEKEKDELSQELQVLRVKNGILYKDNSDLKTDNASKAIYIKQLEEGVAPSNEDVPEIVELEKSRVSMNKDSQKHKCNACDKAFKQTSDLERHMDAKHGQEVCTFCEKTFNSKKQLEGHLNQCLEYGNTIVKCNKCQNTFTRFGIKRHADTCKETQAKVYSCAVCGHRGSSVKDIKRHQAEHESDQIVEVSKEVCKHWRKGHCFKGESCLFSHVGYQQNLNSNSTPKGSINNWTPACHHGEGCSWLSNGNCRYFHKGVGVQKPSAEKSQQRPSQVQGRQNTKMCHFNGRCTNAMCSFKHTSDKGFSQQRGQNRPHMRVQTNGRFNH